MTQVVMADELIPETENKIEHIENHSHYHRFAIETIPMPPRFKTPHPFNPKVKKTGLALMLMHEVLEYNFKLFQKGYRKRLLSRPCIYGVFGRKVGGFWPIKSKCVGCMRCVEEYSSFCRVDRNPKFSQFSDSYWMPKDLTTVSATSSSIIWYEAETGKIQVKGMGYKGAFSDDGWDSIWTDMSEIVRPTRDGVYGREFISTVVDIGRKPQFVDLNNLENVFQKKIMQIPIPFIFDYLPPNISSQSITMSIVEASKKAQTLYLAAYDKNYKYTLNKNERFGLIISYQDFNDMHQDLLDAISCAKLLEYSDEDSDLTSLIDRVRKLRKLNPKVPLIVRLPLSNGIEERVVEISRHGEVDGFHLYADYHGMTFDGDSSEFIKERLHSVHTKLIAAYLRNEITIIASGGIILAEHVPKAIICGADLVALDTTALVALQVKFKGECQTSETGRTFSTDFDSNWGSQRLTNLLGAWHYQLIEILSAMGIRDVRRLRGDIGRAMFDEEIEKEAFIDILRVEG